MENLSGVSNDGTSVAACSSDAAPQASAQPGSAGVRCSKKDERSAVSDLVPGLAVTSAPEKHKESSGSGSVVVASDSSSKPPAAVSEEFPVADVVTTGIRQHTSSINNRNGTPPSSVGNLDGLSPLNGCPLALNNGWSIKAGKRRSRHDRQRAICCFIGGLPSDVSGKDLISSAAAHGVTVYKCHILSPHDSWPDSRAMKAFIAEESAALA